MSLTDEAVPFCPATFDGWGCWDATLAGDVAEIPCPNSDWENATSKILCIS